MHHTSVVRQRARRAAAAFAILAVTAFAVSALASPAVAGQYSSGNSSCTGTEDPVNMLFDYPKVIWYYQATKYDYTSGHTGAYAMSAMANDYWTGGLGSTDSYYNYGSNGGCVDQSDYATDSTTSGHHVRFWMSAIGTRPAGAAHHDFMCGTSHSADQFVDSANSLANWLWNWVDDNGYAANPTWITKQDRNPSSFSKCGEVVPDDGKTQELDYSISPTLTDIEY